MPIKNIVFDVGGVIIKGDLYHSLYKWFKSKEDFDVFIKEIGHRQMSDIWDIGAMDFKDVINEKIKEFPKYKDALIDYRDNWIDVIIGEISETIVLIRALKKAGYKLFILSNFAKETFNILRGKYDFCKYFDGIIISSLVKAIKPNSDIYNILLQTYNLKPEECIFFDDLTANIEGAKKIGIKADIFTDAKSSLAFLNKQGIEIKIDNNIVVDTA